jgi:hypothetical protein
MARTNPLSESRRGRCEARIGTPGTGENMPALRGGAKAVDGEGASLPASGTRGELTESPIRE